MTKLDLKGFTIIELMIATIAFTVILTLTTTAIIGISDTYVKGNVQGQTQESARSILSDVSQSIQFSDPSSINLSGLSSSSGVYYFCLGDDVYVYQLDKKLVTSNPGNSLDDYATWGLVRYNSSICPASAAAIPGNPMSINGASELLAINERLGQLNIAAPASGALGYTISVEVAYGDDDLLSDTSSPSSNGNFFHDANSAPSSYQFKYACKDGPDSSFCAVSALTTTVAPRITN